MLMEITRSTSPMATHPAWRGKESTGISELALCTVASPIAARRRAERISPPSIDDSSRSRGRSSVIGWLPVIDPEILGIEGLRDRCGHLGPAAAVLGEDGHHQLRIVRRREGGEPGMVAVFER